MRSTHGTLQVVYTTGVADPRVSGRDIRLRRAHVLRTRSGTYGALVYDLTTGQWTRLRRTATMESGTSATDSTGAAVRWLSARQRTL